MVMDSKGFIYLVDKSAVRRIDPEFKVTTVSRFESKFRKKEANLLFTLILTQEKIGSYLNGIALDEESKMIYVSDFTNHVIWSLTISGEDPKILAGQIGINSNFRFSFPFFFI